jgi:hypothetical protein
MLKLRLYHNKKRCIYIMDGVTHELTLEEIAAQKVIEDRKSDARKKLRSERDTLINATDKYAFMDYPINQETRKKWNYYRQHLRDLPAMSSPDLDADGNLTGVEWPTPPQ